MLKQLSESKIVESSLYRNFHRASNHKPFDGQIESKSHICVSFQPSKLVQKSLAIRFIKYMNASNHACVFTLLWTKKSLFDDVIATFLSSFISITKKCDRATKFLFRSQSTINKLLALLKYSINLFQRNYHDRTYFVSLQPMSLFREQKQKRWTLWRATSNGRTTKRFRRL